jgi:hypothetical protein
MPRRRANTEPIGVDVHYHHVSMLRRAAAAGRAWAHAALAPDAPLLYVAAGGVDEGLLELVARSDRSLIALTLDDLFA